ncbi:MAG: pyridoxal-phosphate dependent enzyme [Sphaerochaeta sp.]|nr:pyridoxal-phosphate dependent enzyme [Spirochaetales bacterium]
MKFNYVCNDCHGRYKSKEIFYQCPKCSALNDGSSFALGNVIVRLDESYLSKLRRKKQLSVQDFLPYQIKDPLAFPVANTPIVHPKALREATGLKNLFFKLDGALPSGSFKDRASILIAAQALAHKQSKIALASTGNAGAAMSAAGAAYGLEIILFVPESAPLNKLMQSVLYGATVVPVKGSYDDAFALSIAYTQEFGGINRNTAYNPMTIEGKKSVSIELFLQLGRKVPEVVYVPTGDGCIFAGVYKGFSDLKDAGLIHNIPHLVAAQSTASNAISKAWGTGDYSNLRRATTLADSISVESPANGRMAVRYISESNGWATEVTDQEILSAQLELASEAGLFVEPAAACAWAALKKDTSMLLDRFGENVEVCTLLTGTGFKDMAVFDGRISIPAAIENSVDAMRARFA